MGKIFRKNIFTGEEEWVDFEPGIERIHTGWTSEKEYSTAWTTPQTSIAAACHSEDVQAFNEDYRKHGITGAYHRPDGVLVMETNQARNQVLALRGLHDRDACYRQHAG